MIHDFHRGVPAEEIAERDDGDIATSGGPGMYFAPVEEWQAPERQAISLAKGRVLDIGCGAGRVGLHLQSKGMSVVGIDNSPLAVKVCRLRGLKSVRVMSVTEIGPALGKFDTIVMYGNNFGVMGGWKRGRWLLKRLNRITNPGARILASTLDPYQTKDPIHLAYHRRNRARGRMGGQVRLRIRYRNCATPWFDYLMVSREEMNALLDGTGWRMAKTFDSADMRYVAVIEKAG
jgi:2-polyprenyl-3-methyl-5-hydroxy-6-metoxy-1,4-benzoquinol methylase